PKRRRGRAHHPFKGAYPGARIVRGKSRQGTVDELRVGGHGGLSPKSQARHHPWPEILDDHIRRRHQTPRYVEIIRLLEIEADAALAPVPGGVRRRIPDRTTWRLDPNDVA